MRELVLVRHAHAFSNAGDVVSCRPPGEGLSAQGVDEARRLGELLASERVGLGVATELVRTQETLQAALRDRPVPTVVLPQLNEIAFGSFEGRPLADYRAWAWTAPPDADCPGGGESRAAAAARFADGLDTLLARPEDLIVAVAHALPVRYVLDAADGRAPAARVERVEHAHPYRLDRADVERAGALLRAWSKRPRFRDAG